MSVPLGREEDEMGTGSGEEEDEEWEREKGEWSKQVRCRDKTEIENSAGARCWGKCVPNMLR